MKNTVLVFRIFLYLMLGSVVAATAWLWLNRADFFEKFPNMRAVFPLYLLTAGLLVAGLAGLIFWKKIGLWLLTVGAVLAFGIEVYAGLPLSKIMRIPVSLVLMLVLVYPHLGRLK